jgi:iron only hydrogenase large subunit-like protein
MACHNGCIGGPCSLSHSLVDKNVIDRYGKESKEQTIKDAISSFIDEE